MADGVMDLPSGTVLWDTSVVNAFTYTLPQAAIKAKVEEKNKKYCEITKANGSSFRPVVFDHLGGTDPGVKKLLEIIAVHVSPTSIRHRYWGRNAQKLIAQEWSTIIARSTVQSALALRDAILERP
jgi:hypothetical protein